MKVTVEAPANIAFVKYWGARDLERAVPANPSLSMTLRSSVARTTIEPLAGDDDRVELAAADGSLAPAGERFAAGVRRHLDRLRAWSGASDRFRVATRNNFPTGAGIASSAAGFAALATAFVDCLGRPVEPAGLSRLARASGSGSAARSVLGGYVRWPAAGAEPDGDAVQIAPAGHWELCDLIVIVERGEKAVSSRQGHERAATSPHFARRLELLDDRLAAAERAIAGRDLAALGPVLEEEAIELHLVAMSSRPPIFYWCPATLAVLAAVRRLRSDGLAAWITMDAGPNVHVLCEPADAGAAERELREVAGVEEVLVDGVGDGPRRLDEHLF